MNVASATSTASWPSTVMTPRAGATEAATGNTRTPPAEGQAGGRAGEPLVNRFPSIAFSYDTDASRLVMLYRDPANGKTVAQIPTEAALKQYKEAQQQERNAERASLLKLTVDGGAGGAGGAGGDPAGTRRAGDAGAGSGSGSGGFGSSSGTRAASLAIAASVAGGPVAQSSVPGSVSAPAASGGANAARVNVVI